MGQRAEHASSCATPGLGRSLQTNMTSAISAQTTLSCSYDTESAAQSGSELGVSGTWCSKTTKNPNSIRNLPPPHLASNQFASLQGKRKAY